MKNKTKKLAKLERNRVSIFTDDLEHCYICKLHEFINPKDDMHEIFRGRNRINSMKYGLCIPICRFHHSKFTDDPILEKEWKIIGQEKFMEIYDKTKEDFIDIFGKNYL